MGAAAPSFRKEEPAWTVHTTGPNARRILDRGNLYSAAKAFVDGDIDIEGDLVAALRALTPLPRKGLSQWFYTALARLWKLWPESWYQSRTRARHNIQSHYDHPSEFYRRFLDRRMVYSCAYFENPGMTLDEAQAAKLDHICRKLDLQPGERFLDIGCGFGALVAHAAERYFARAIGCTLSTGQLETGRRMLAERGLEGRASLEPADYRELRGIYDKIASVGMVEHVGARRLRGYFAKVHAMLAEGGLFLNHGIARPQTVKAGVESIFLQRRVFPGGELVDLSGTIREAESAGFEVLDVEKLRPHYGLTCRAWVDRLRQNQDACIALAGKEAYRTWILYLATSALSFESGSTEVHQVLLAKRGASRATRWSRRYVYS